MGNGVEGAVDAMRAFGEKHRMLGQSLVGSTRRRRAGFVQVVEVVPADGIDVTGRLGDGCMQAHLGQIEAGLGFGDDLPYLRQPRLAGRNQRQHAGGVEIGRHFERFGGCRDIHHRALLRHSAKAWNPAIRREADEPELDAGRRRNCRLPAFLGL